MGQNGEDSSVSLFDGSNKGSLLLFPQSVQPLSPKNPRLGVKEILEEIVLNGQVGALMDSLDIRKAMNAVKGSTRNLAVLIEVDQGVLSESDGLGLSVPPVVAVLAPSADRVVVGPEVGAVEAILRTVSLLCPRLASLLVLLDPLVQFLLDVSGEERDEILKLCTDPRFGGVHVIPFLCLIDQTGCVPYADGSLHD